MYGRYSKAILAINGYVEPVHCTHTNPEKDPWWKVTFKHEVIVYAVDIFNRVECCSKKLNDTMVMVLNNNQGKRQSILRYEEGTAPKACFLGRREFKVKSFSILSISGAGSKV